MRGKTASMACCWNGLRGFNEAPALCGGRPARCLSACQSHRSASMRPPHCAGEDGPPPPDGAVRACSFNEAPALCGGRPLRAEEARRPMIRFNEAPALCGGRRDASSRQRGRTTASMRPPHCAGEDSCSGTPWKPWPSGAPSERLCPRLGSSGRAYRLVPPEVGLKSLIVKELCRLRALPSLIASTAVVVAVRRAP